MAILKNARERSYNGIKSWELIECSEEMLEYYKENGFVEIEEEKARIEVEENEKADAEEKRRLEELEKEALKNDTLKKEEELNSGVSTDGKVVTTDAWDDTETDIDLQAKTYKELQEICQKCGLQFVGKSKEALILSIEDYLINK